MTHWFTTLGRLREAFWLLYCSPISIAHSLHSLYPTVAEVSADANCTKKYEPGYTRWINNTRISTKPISKVNSIKHFPTPWNYKGHYQATNYKTVQDIMRMVTQLIWWARWKPSQVCYVVWNLLRLTHRLEGTIMNWQQDREAFEKNSLMRQSTNSYQELALMARNIRKYTNTHQSNITNANVLTILRLSNSASCGKETTLTLTKYAELQYALSIIFCVNCAQYHRLKNT